MLKGINIEAKTLVYILSYLYHGEAREIFLKIILHFLIHVFYE